MLINDPTKLLEAIETWYDQNGSGSQIPTWDSHGEPLATAFEETFNNSSNHTVSYGGGDIYEVSGNLLPLLAGVKLGFSLDVLKEIIIHHDITMGDIDNLGYDDDTAGNQYTILKQRSGKNVSKIDFVAAALQAMILVTSRQYEMSHSSFSKSIVQLGLMHTNDSECWPSHHIKTRSEQIQQAAPNNYKSQTVSKLDYAFIITNLSGESSMPNSSPMDFLNRVGMLLPETAKRSTAHYALWEEMAEQSMKGNECCTKILEFCANHPNPDFQNRVKHALVSLGGYEFMDDPGEMHNHLKSIFNNETYRETLAKVTPRINLVPYDPGEFLAYFPEDPEYCDFLKNKEILLSTVAKETLEQPLENLGYNQLNVFSKLKSMELPAQRIEGFTPEVLINHVVDGIVAYTAKLPLETCNKTRMDADVKGSLADLITLVQLHHKIDYTAFEHRISSDKALLIECGFPIREMTGLTYQDKGYIFTRELGI